MPAERLNTFPDQSVLVTVSVFRQVAPNAQDLFTDFAAEIAPDMVLVGGGGTGTEGPRRDDPAASRERDPSPCGGGGEVCCALH